MFCFALAAISVDVIDSKKHNVVKTTTSTLAAVVVDNFLL